MVKEWKTQWSRGITGLREKMQRLWIAKIEKAIEKKHYHNLVEAPNHHLNVNQVKGQDVVEIEVQEVGQEVNHVINQKV